MNERSAAALYGAGVFTTLRIVDGEPWLWEKHWRRLTTHADKFGIDLTAFSEQTVLNGLKERLASDGIPHGRARITFHDNRSSDVWPGDIVGEGTIVSIITGPTRRNGHPFRCEISPHVINSTSPIAGLKTCNYLEQLMSLEGAKRRAFNEAIRVNERGHVTSACMANLFWLHSEKLFTPALSTGCLSGTTREFILENLECAEVEVAIEELDAAEAMFLTSAGIGVVRIDECDSRRLDEQHHSILELLPY